jgi:hypothetical protein
VSRDTFGPAGSVSPPISGSNRIEAGYGRHPGQPFTSWNVSPSPRREVRRSGSAAFAG